MKTTCKVLLAVLLLGSSAGAASAATSVSAGIHVGPSGRATVDLGFFYDDLAPYGNWIERPSYGWVWTPRNVAADWRPYEDGHWVWTDEGWLWVTDEPYGWATYHYGRWYDDSDLGWAWVPDDEWGPAWVSWQEGADYVGWAPLPPRVSVSVSFSRGYAYGIHPEAYVFVPERHFLAPGLAAYVVAGPRIESIFRETRNCTSYQYRGGRAFNRGVPLDRIERFGRRAPRYQVADLAPAYRNRGPRFQGDRVTVFRPQVQRAARLAPPISRPAARNSVVTAERFRANNPRRAAAIEHRQKTRPQTSVREQRAVRETRETGRQRQARIDQTPRKRSPQIDRRVDNRAAANARREQAAARQARAAKVEHQRTARVGRQRAARVERERSVRHERQRPAVEHQERQRAVKAQREQSVQRRQARQRTEAVRQREARGRQAERVDRSQRRQRPERQVAPARHEPRPQRLHAQERQRRQPQMQRERPARQQHAARERARKENGRPNRQHGHGQ